ncbi:hypothetical protein [Actinoallomurus acaciae]|uniref:Uncharacterized protein n=1 Tax=Actinoallomurus acaciae TaxID=502577 RepID=A0ABV5YD94_9ACTN
MSEYQYYEFLAVDRPLDDAQQAEVRTLSTRARITATSFTNEYHWGDFRGDPRRLVERYYDAHLYLANWGTRRVMFRLPLSLLALDVAEQYCTGEHMAAWTSRDYLILDMTSEDETGEWGEGDEDALSAIVGVRAELAGGDLRPLYLAWLSGYRIWDEDAFEYEDEDELEPPVPPGLGSLSAPQRALADFLRLDPALLTVAAQASPTPPTAKDDASELADWIITLPPKEKDDLLVRAVQDQAAQVRIELLRRFRGTPDLKNARRTVAELLKGLRT